MINIQYAQPGDLLVIRGINGNVLAVNVPYKRSYTANGRQFVVFEEDGITKSVDVMYVESVVDAAITQFTERLNEALDILGDIGANYCGDLTQAQAKKFHRLCDRLTALAEEVEG